LMQLLIGISTRRYFPPSGTAGFARSLVRGKRRVPAPPPIMIDNVFSVVPGGRACVITGKESPEYPRRSRSCVVTMLLIQHPSNTAIFLRVAGKAPLGVILRPIALAITIDTINHVRNGCLCRTSRGGAYLIGWIAPA